MTNIDRWMEVYEKCLERVVREDNERPAAQREYHFSPGLVPTIAAKMKTAFIQNSFNKDGRAIKMTCKHFGVKHTYEAIRRFLSDVDTASVSVTVPASGTVEDGI